MINDRNSNHNYQSLDEKFVVLNVIMGLFLSLILPFLVDQ